MASSNRHWPSMFRSKPTYNNNTHQWQSQGSNRASPYASGCDERTPEPKPRWNPKPEQIRILESIFNSGMVNPPRDEIRKIRTRLQEYGHVGDANVFYWFQNRKSRSKNKNRHLQKSQNSQILPAYPGGASVTKAATTSSSSSSDKSSSKSIEFLMTSPTASVNQQPQAYIGGGGITGSHHHCHGGGFYQEPYFFPVTQQLPPPGPTTTVASFTQEFCFPNLTTIINQENHHHGTNHDPTKVVSSSEMLLTDLMMSQQYGIPNKNNSKSKDVENENLMKMLSHTPPAAPPAPAATTTTTIAPSTIIDFQGGVEEGGIRGKSIVFINDVAFEVGIGGFNVKEAFGEDAVLVDSTGQTVVTNEWGLTTLESLHHGGFYYLMRTITTYDDHHAGTIDLI